MRDGERARLLRGRGERGRVLEAAEEVRLREDHRGGVLRRGGEPSGSMTPPSCGDLDDLEPEAGRIGLDDLAHLRVQRLGEDDARAAGHVLRDEARVGRDRKPSYPDAFETSIPVSSQIAVWYSKIACRTPWLISGWYGVYAVRNSPRRRIGSTIAGT